VYTILLLTDVPAPLFRVPWVSEEVSSVPTLKDVTVLHSAHMCAIIGAEVDKALVYMLFHILRHF
jgi:hypothetical protein